MRQRRIFGIASAALLAGAALLAQEPEGVGIVPPRFASAEQSALYDRVSSRLIAPCCWAAPVRLHQSQAASKVRLELIAAIRGGMNENEIQDRFAREYGERILGQPRGARNVWAYTIPSVLSTLSLVGLGVFLSARTRRAKPTAEPPAGEPEPLPEIPDFD